MINILNCGKLHITRVYINNSYKAKKKGSVAMVLYIKTLGDFDMIYNGKSIFEDTSRSYKLNKLFQYFLTFRGKKLLPETIINNLWQDTESLDPQNMLRTQIYRLRRVLNAIIPEGSKNNDYLNIQFKNGYYFLELGPKAILDIDEFEQLIVEGDQKRQKDIEEAIEIYKKALKLYKGKYLSENPYEPWLVPSRNYCTRLFIVTSFKLLDALNEKERYEEVIQTCEEVLLLEPSEEAIHIYLMKSLLSLGKINKATSHYNYIEDILHRELGGKQSPALKEMRKDIDNFYIKNKETDIYNIRNQLEMDSDDNLAIYCDLEHFKFLYNIQMRKASRSDEKDYLILISLINESFYHKDELNAWKEIIKDVLAHSLRKGDAFTSWNDTQIMVMIHKVNDNGPMVIEDRIRTNFNNRLKDKNYNIRMKFQAITSGSKIQ